MECLVWCPTPRGCTLNACACCRNFLAWRKSALRLVGILRGLITAHRPEECSSLRSPISRVTPFSHVQCAGGFPSILPFPQGTLEVPTLPLPSSNQSCRLPERARPSGPLNFHSFTSLEQQLHVPVWIETEVGPRKREGSGRNCLPFSGDGSYHCSSTHQVLDGIVVSG